VTAPDEFFVGDFDGDGILDPLSLTAAGAPELLTGDYSLLVFTSNIRMRNFRSVSVDRRDVLRARRGR